ncbi:thiamine ABC transporter permease [Clostridium thermosuccinogenes]|uniref:Thiamine ABC transporter permease n=1 Tax=Clostridium thermosuccinogenes TaxID=84032 RepID=A0A2K2FN44_9CLOT|nr:ABC transporter ATP-binding protein [Pseudoclostridium thermosuccinogenes]AUS97905.1 thiamine ABC transporter permease [Pseudoclostridium thermosuccinogenes]PNU00202.1 thiamine ABC transporter permease [Pseudoclostridium thermosuccinogenes]PNU01526.1 thiamine ABC transporter permease [Pseudoclostridium thermosuccinogenes]
MSVLKKFMRYYKPYRGIFFLDMFCALVLSLIDLAFPQILNILTDEVFTDTTGNITRVVVYVGAGLLVMYAVRYVCEYYITSWGHAMGARMESDMRQDLFDHYQRLSFSYYDRNNTGEMMSKLISDLFDIAELAHHGPENIFISVLKIIGSFALLMMINVRMTLILLCVTTVMVVFSFRKNIKMRRTFLDNRRKIAKVNSRLQDTLSGIRVVQSFANESLEQEKFSKSNIEFLDSKIESYKVMGSFHAGNGFFQGLLYTVVLVSGGYFIAKGSLKADDLAIYALYIGIFLNPLNVLINFTEQFQKGYSGFVRFLEVIETEPEIVDKKNAVELTDVKGDITFENVSFQYKDDAEVLNSISIDIKAGKTVALVGPSGGGKTTLCSLIPRFYDVTAGAVKVDGIDVRDVTLKSLRKAIGIVQQDVYIFDGSIRDNIAYGKPGATDEEIIEAAKNADIHDFIMSLEDGYNSHVGERGTRLSGGQKQRIAIARVFLKDPKILILDEATSALDNESERHIQASLDRLSKNRTTIVIAHRLSTIRNADEILVISNNSVQEQGTHEELLKRNGLYAKYYNMQFEGLDEIIM